MFANESCNFTQGLLSIWNETISLHSDVIQYFLPCNTPQWTRGGGGRLLWGRLCGVLRIHFSNSWSGRLCGWARELTACLFLLIIIIISLKHPLDCIMTLTPHPFIGWSKQGRFCGCVCSTHEADNDCIRSVTWKTWQKSALERWAIEGAECLDRLISCLRGRILLQRLCSVKMQLLPMGVLRNFVTARGKLLGFYVPRPQRSNDSTFFTSGALQRAEFTAWLRAAVIAVSIQWRG